ncbi:unnamed protein product [Porites lobata]|uniref:Uncharacterized protein n=1 Tax=Porites lobata TaxID=104759 RepID=A0ABN8P7D2_9CNID|nr:unnamed protein product [Porites lobata]
MGLYKLAKKLQMTRQDLGHIIHRPGEVHIVMDQPRTIGAFIENSGLDMCWIESDLYGPSTVKQILRGNHVKRGEAAHMPLPGSLLRETPSCVTVVKKSANQLSDTLKKATNKILQQSTKNWHRPSLQQSLLQRWSNLMLIMRIVHCSSSLEGTWQ